MTKINTIETLIQTKEPETRKQVLVVSERTQNGIDQIIHEYYQKSKLKHSGLSHPRKITLYGQPGTGKTTTANVLAYELKMPLYNIQVDRLVDNTREKTRANLDLIFDFMQENLGAYFFDASNYTEHDAIDIIKLLLRFFDQSFSDSIFITSFNNSPYLDSNIYKSSDIVLCYDNPTDEEIKSIIANRLGSFLPKDYKWDEIIRRASGSSHSDIVLACKDVIKIAILADKKKIDTAELFIAVHNRKQTYEEIYGYQDDNLDRHGLD